MTADHKVLNEDDESRDQDRLALIIQDAATYWLQGVPVQNKTHQAAMHALQRYMPPKTRPHYIYTDNSK